YEIRSIVSTSSYNKGREVGPCALLRTGRDLFFFWSWPRRGDAPMTDLQNLIAISCLPSWSWFHAAARLRAGATAEHTLQSLIDAHWRDQSDKAATLRTRAAAALRRASAQGIDVVPWSDPRYPAALATIADPPPVLWVRGKVDVLNATS